MESYSTISLVTGNVTASPTGYGNVPTIELVRRELCQYGVGALITVSVRKLARAIGRSAGQMSVHLDRLEADGWIRRLADHAGTVIEVLRGIDHPCDRSFTAAESDHADDRALGSDHAGMMPNPAPAAAPLSEKSDHADDPPLHPPIRYKHDHASSSSMRAHANRAFDGQDPAIAQLLKIGLWGEQIAEWVKHHGYTAEYIQREWQKAQTRPDLGSPEALLYKCLKNNEPVYSAADLAARAQEASHAQPPSTKQPSRGRPASHRAQRAAAPAVYPGGAGDPVADAERAAILAYLEQQRTVPV